MATLTVISWREIPSQVTIKGTAGTVKAMLDDRFQVAIDAAAAVAGLEGEDDYLEQWQRARRTCGEEIEAELAAEVARLEAAFPPERLKATVAAGGVAAGGVATDAAEGAGAGAAAGDPA